MSKDNQGAIIYDYTSHAMKRIIDRYMDKNDIQSAFVFSEALHYYEQGLVEIQWVGGIPYAMSPDPMIRETLVRAGAKAKTHAEFLDSLPVDPRKSDEDEMTGIEPEKDENENPNDSE